LLRDKEKGEQATQATGVGALEMLLFGGSCTRARLSIQTKGDKNKMAYVNDLGPSELSENCRGTWWRFDPGSFV
jgi:hypothetical protein